MKKIELDALLKHFWNVNYLYEQEIQYSANPLSVTPGNISAKVKRETVVSSLHEFQKDLLEAQTLAERDLEYRDVKNFLIHFPDSFS